MEDKAGLMEYGAFLMECRALSMECRALLTKFRALLGTYSVPNATGPFFATVTPKDLPSSSYV